MKFLAVSWWIYLAMLQRALGNAFGWRDAYQGAVRCLGRALAHRPKDAHLYLWRGTLYWRELRQGEQAEVDLSRALELDPQLARAYLNRAFARLEAVPPDRGGAAADLRAFLELDQDSTWHSVATGYLQQLQGPAPEEATEDELPEDEITGP